MPAPQLVMPVLDLAAKIGVASPSTVQEDILTDWMLDAQAAVEDYLNRPIFPFEVTRTGMFKDGRYPETDWRAWPWAVTDYDDAFRVVSATADAEGTWSVTLEVGLDGPGTHGIVSFVKSAVRERARADDRFPTVPRIVRSVSAEGQSLSYAEPSTAKGASTAEPSLEDLVRHRRFSVHRARSRTSI